MSTPRVLIRSFKFSIIALLSVMALLLVMPNRHDALLNHAQPAKPDQANQQRLVESYGKLPMSFEANRGQTDPRVKFLSRGSGYTLFLAGDEAVLALRRQKLEARS